MSAPRVCIVGPLPPPFGGMANQCELLVRLLGGEGIDVEHVRTNAPYQPAWAGRVPLLRAGFRLVPYLLKLWRAAGRSQVIHVFANSGWSWHLFVTPALLVARIRCNAVIVNYRGGSADSFLARAPRHVLRSLRLVSIRVTPSSFLHRVFARYGLEAEVVPNIIDLTLFKRVQPRAFGSAPRILVARNLEPIYDIATAIRAFKTVQQFFPAATLTVAGGGPELERLRLLVTELELDGAVSFIGRVENSAMPQLYALADCVVNPSTVDNMPISLLEAFASGLPVVSTDAGGIPDMLCHEVSGLLVPVGDAQAMGREMCRVLQDPVLAARLVAAGCAEAEKYAWPRVKALWLDVYRRAAEAQGAA